MPSWSGMHSGGGCDQIPCSSQKRTKPGASSRSSFIVNPSSHWITTPSGTGNVPLGRMFSMPAIIVPFTGVGLGHVWEPLGGFRTEIKKNIFHHHVRFLEEIVFQFLGLHKLILTSSLHWIMTASFTCNVPLCRMFPRISFSFTGVGSVLKPFGGFWT